MMAMSFIVILMVLWQLRTRHKNVQYFKTIITMLSMLFNYLIIELFFHDQIALEIA